jgi:hypothetical protein
VKKRLTIAVLIVFIGLPVLLWASINLAYAYLLRQSTPLPNPPSCTEPMSAELENVWDKWHGSSPPATKPLDPTRYWYHFLRSSDFKDSALYRWPGLVPASHVAMYHRMGEPPSPHLRNALAEWALSLHVLNHWSPCEIATFLQANGNLQAAPKSLRMEIIEP